MIVFRKGPRAMAPHSVPFRAYLDAGERIEDLRLEQQRLRQVRVEACHPDPWELALHGPPRFRFRRAPYAFRLRWRCS